MGETSGQYRLKAPHTRLELDAEGKSQKTQYGVGDVITPTEAELAAFADRFEPVSAAPAQPMPEEPTPDEPAPRSRR